MDVITTTERIDDIPTLAAYDADAAAPLPLVFLLHGFTGRKEDNRANVAALARRGYYAVALDAHLHGELGSQPFDPADAAARMLEVTLVTTGFVDHLIDYYAHVAGPADASRVGLMGTSMGGAIIMHYLPRRHPSLKAAVVMIAGFPSLWPTVLRNAKPLYPAFGVTDAAIAAAEKIESPPLLEGVRDFPLLMLYGEADPIIPIGAVREVHAQIEARYGDSEKLKMVSYAGVGHEVPPRMLVEAVKWLAQYV